MNWLGRALGQLMMFTLLVTNASCGASEESSRPTINVSVGMSVADLRQNSSYELGEDPSANPSGIGAYSISGPFDLEYGIGPHRLAIEDIGGPSLRSLVIISDGNVEGLEIVPQKGGLTLVEAIDRARELADWFRRAGFQEHTSYSIWNKRRGANAPAITSLESARDALSDSNLVVAQMNLFSGDREGLRVGVSIANGRRIRALAGSRSDADERGVATERQWILHLSLVPAVDDSRAGNAD